MMWTISILDYLKPGTNIVDVKKLNKALDKLRPEPLTPELKSLGTIIVPANVQIVGGGQHHTYITKEAL